MFNKRSKSIIVLLSVRGLFCYFFRCYCWSTLSHQHFPQTIHHHQFLSDLFSRWV